MENKRGIVLGTSKTELSERIDLWLISYLVLDRLPEYPGHLIACRLNNKISAWQLVSYNEKKNTTNKSVFKTY
jgi:hypothetical protein